VLGADEIADQEHGLLVEPVLAAPSGHDALVDERMRGDT
jgi:hypothetical protein